MVGRSSAPGGRNCGSALSEAQGQKTVLEAGGANLHFGDLSPIRLAQNGEHALPTDLSQMPLYAWTYNV